MKLMRSLLITMLGGFVGAMLSSVTCAKQYHYKTATMFEAVKTGNKRDVAEYLKSGVEVNDLDEQGKTVLDYAVDQENKSLIKMLLRKQARVTSDYYAVRCEQLVLQKNFWKSLGYFVLGLVSSIVVIGCFGAALFAVIPFIFCLLSSSAVGVLMYGAMLFGGAAVGYGALQLIRKSNDYLYGDHLGSESYQLILS